MHVKKEALKMFVKLRFIKATFLIFYILSKFLFEIVMCAWWNWYGSIHYELILISDIIAWTRMFSDVRYWAVNRNRKILTKKFWCIPFLIEGLSLKTDIVKFTQKVFLSRTVFFKVDVRCFVLCATNISLKPIHPL